MLLIQLRRCCVCCCVCPGCRRDSCCCCRRRDGRPRSCGGSEAGDACRRLLGCFYRLGVIAEEMMRTSPPPRDGKMKGHRCRSQAAGRTRKSRRRLCGMRPPPHAAFPQTRCSAAPHLSRRTAEQRGGSRGGRKAQDWWGIAAREWQAGGGLGRSGGPGAGHAQLWTLLCPDSPTSAHLIYRPLGQRNPVHLPASPRCRNRAWRGRRRGRRHHCRRRWRRHGGRRLGRRRLGCRCVACIVALRSSHLCLCAWRRSVRTGAP
jgi:hypothetical protein